jgi:hypothetical protein
MALPGGRDGRPGWLARAAMLASAGISAFVVLALFVAHGQAHEFALGAVATGAGTAAAAALLAGLRRVPWGTVVSLAALVSFWEDLSFRRR